MKLNLLSKLTDLFSDDFPDLYLVGGTVRDLQMKRECKDVDIACKNAGNIAQTFARPVQSGICTDGNKA